MEFRRVTEIPSEIDLREIIRVIAQFYVDCQMYIDFRGFVNNTLEKFSLATFLKSGVWDLWLASDGPTIKCYVLGSLDKAGDGQPCYYLHQAWVAKDIRDTGLSKKWWLKLKQRARELLCRQMIIFSIRNYEAYNRFLGGGLNVYAQMLHMKLEV